MLTEPPLPERLHELADLPRRDRVLDKHGQALVGRDACAVFAFLPAFRRSANERGRMCTRRCFNSCDITTICNFGSKKVDISLVRAIVAQLSPL